MKGIEGAFDIVGGQAALAYFATLDPSRLSHGYIFSGPVGVGKKTFARRIAQSLLCETPKGTLLGYCGTCPGCTLFVAGTHPDFVSSEGRIKISFANSRCTGIVAAIASCCSATYRLRRTRRRTRSSNFSKSRRRAWS
jgi:hypothetical protein